MVPGIFALQPHGQYKVFRISFWMRRYGSKTPKRTTMWSNNRKVFKFATGKLKLKKRDRSHVLATYYIDSQGRKRFTGKGKAMKRSAQLV